MKKSDALIPSADAGFAIDQTHASPSNFRNACGKSGTVSAR